MTNEFKIEKGVPLPKAFSRYRKYPRSEMAVGDSIIADDRARSAAQIWGKNNGAVFSGRKQPDGSTRIWRVE